MPTVIRSDTIGIHAGRRTRCWSLTANPPPSNKPASRPATGCAEVSTYWPRTPTAEVAARSGSRRPPVRRTQAPDGIPAMPPAGRRSETPRSSRRRSVQDCIAGRSPIGTAPELREWSPTCQPCRYKISCWQRQLSSGTKPSGREQRRCNEVRVGVARSSGYRRPAGRGRHGARVRAVLEVVAQGVDPVVCGPRRCQGRLHGLQGNPADILEGTAKLANYVQYKCHPVVDVAE